MPMRTDGWFNMKVLLYLGFLLLMGSCESMCEESPEYRLIRVLETREKGRDKCPDPAPCVCECKTK